MPRFTDEWIVTKSLFEHTTGGSCACCSFPALFDPDGLKGLISSVSDLETDAADQEYKSANESPWPPEMRDAVWADRVKIRYKMKKEMGTYKDFMLEVGDEECLINWCVDELGAESLRRIFQMPRSEVIEILNTKYGVCEAYACIMSAVVEQVANFGITKYDTDARGEEEMAFEKMLKFNRRGGFMLGMTKNKVEGDKKEIIIDDEALRMFVAVVRSLGGPKLLHRGPSTSEDAENEGTDNAWKDDTKNKGGPSFRSDRRITRLVIARYWADQLISKYQISLSKVKIDQKE
jgi:hypothetical protein